MSRVWNALLDAVYPPDLRCYACRKEAQHLVDHLCPDCHKRLAVYEGPACPLCGRPTEQYGRCRDCRRHPPSIARGRAAYVYDGEARELLHRMKFEGQTYLASFLAERLVLAMVPIPKLDCVVPVPSHGLRVVNRGYSVAGILAREFCGLTHLPYAGRTLVRRRLSRPRYLVQEDWTLEDAMRDFALRDASGVAGKRVLLIDDILTSGSTVSACAQRLQEAGAQAVYSVVVAAARQK